MNALTFAAAALQFISCLEGANVALSSMLMSKSTSDVVEALRFYVRAKQFQLPCAITGMRSALSLMWSSEKQVQSAVLKAFVDVFVGQQGTDGKKLLEDKAIAHNLIVLVGESTISEQVSIEEAIR
jgi:condensin complex subunit 1